MLEAKELMIGDWVRITEFKDRPFNLEFQISTGGMTAVRHGVMKVEPIPLTEEILNLNGLYKDSEGNYHFRIRPAGIERHDIVEKVLNSFNICKSVHEFQQLLRCLKIEKPIQIYDKICLKSE